MDKFLYAVFYMPLYLCISVVFSILLGTIRGLGHIFVGIREELTLSARRVIPNPPYIEGLLSPLYSLGLIILTFVSVWIPFGLLLLHFIPKFIHGPLEPMLVILGLVLGIWCTLALGNALQDTAYNTRREKTSGGRPDG